MSRTLFLHGAGFTRMWLPFHEALSRVVDLIAPEHPGYGETEMPEWLDGFDDLVLHYDDFLDALELERVHLVGYSLGGWIAAELAVFYPERLKSLTLITPAGLRIPGKPIANLVAMAPEQFFDALFNDHGQHGRTACPTRQPRRDRPPVRRGATLARLAWNPQYDLKLERRLRARRVPDARRRAPSTTA